MDYNELYQTIEDVNRMNRTIDEMNRFNDPVQRDVIVGDWKRKKPLSKKNQRTSIIILLIFILLMVGAFVTFVYAEQPSTSERYEQLLDEETRQKWNKMNSQMEEYQQKKEERHNRWMLMVYICAAIAVIPTINMLGQFVLGKLELKSAKDVLYIFSVCIGLGILLFAINLGAVYLMFYAERSIQVMALAAILFGGGAALWIASFRTKKKNP